MRKSISMDAETAEILTLLGIKNLSKFIRFLVRGDAEVAVETDEKNQTKKYTAIYRKWKIQ